MTENARSRILARLRRALLVPGANQLSADPVAPKRLSPDKRIERLKQLMEAVRTEVYIAPSNAWIETLKEIVRRKNIRSLLFAPQTDLGDAIAGSWRSDPDNPAQLRPYDRKTEAFKEELFGIDAAITGTQGAIAETGALILWPTPAEPRLMSLVPPIHIAVLPAQKIHDTFADAIRAGNWAESMPTNALLISGPSKTADIEMTLAFGVHGPKELIVIIVEDQENELKGEDFRTRKKLQDI